MKASQARNVIIYALWNTLEKAKKLRWIELSPHRRQPLLEQYPGGVFYDLGMPQLDCLIQTFKFPGQFSTHIDFYGHFIKGAPLSKQYGVKDMVFPLCVVDITAKMAQDPCYAVTSEDIWDYEAQYGPIPDGTFVTLYTGWSKRWPDMDTLSGIGADGSENFPHWSMDAVKYIYEVRSAASNNHETLDMDVPREAIALGNLTCERYVLSKEKLQIELLSNLDQVPPAGAVLVAPIEMATVTKAYFCGKPNPLMMRTGLRLLKCHFEVAVMVGDQIDTDMISGPHSPTLILSTKTITCALWIVSSLNSFCTRSVRVICCWGCFCFAGPSEL